MGANEAPTRKTGWEKFWKEMLPTELQLILATVFTIAIIVVVAVVGINEPGRMQAFARNYEARSIESGGVMFASSCTPCHGPQGEGIEGIAPALNRPELFNGERLAEVGWAGSLRDFVELTIAAGRPTTTDYPNPMPTWSQAFGGPLRPDQIEALTNFVLNWEGGPYATGPAEAAPEVAEGEPGERYIGTDMESELPEGDPARGQTLFESELGCSACHVAGAGTVAPDIQGIATRAGATVAGLSAEDYIRESIQRPEAYAVEGYDPVMTNLLFGDKLTPQDLADLIAYLMTLE